MTEDKKPSYHTHMTTTTFTPGINYDVTCSCGYRTIVASLSDVMAAEIALRHVKDAQNWCRNSECSLTSHPEYCNEPIAERLNDTD